MGGKIEGLMSKVNAGAMVINSGKTHKTHPKDFVISINDIKTKKEFKAAREYIKDHFVSKNGGAANEFGYAVLDKSDGKDDGKIDTKRIYSEDYEIYKAWGNLKLKDKKAQAKWEATLKADSELWTKRGDKAETSFRELIKAKINKHKANAAKSKVFKKALAEFDKEKAELAKQFKDIKNVHAKNLVYQQEREVLVEIHRSFLSMLGE